MRAAIVLALAVIPVYADIVTPSEKSSDSLTNPYSYTRLVSFYGVTAIEMRVSGRLGSDGTPYNPRVLLLHNLPELLPQSDFHFDIPAAADPVSVPEPKALAELLTAITLSLLWIRRKRS